MKLKFFRSLWGAHLPTHSENIAATREAGFDGIEYIALPDDQERRHFGEQLTAHQLDFILQLGTGAGTGPAIGPETPQQHADSFEHEYLLGMELSPLLVNSHTGRDIFTPDENHLTFERAARLESEHGIPVFHETHRGRATSTVPATLAILGRYPGIKFTSDLSHWTCAHESLLEDQQQSLQSIAPHIHHIHARVGNAQSPQISDPRDPVHADALNAHLRFWKQVISHRFNAGHELTTITVEFGPPPYFPGEFCADKLWEINRHFLAYLKENLTA